MPPKRMTEEERNGQRLLAAYYHYSEHMSKTDISHRLQTSVTQVSRLLEEARKNGIIRVEYTPPEMRDLETRLLARYRHLQEAIVIPAIQELPFLRRMLAVRAGEYFERSIEKNKRVAIGGGITLYEMIDSLIKRERDVQIFPSALVGRGPSLFHIDPLSLVSLLWMKSGHKPDQAYSATILPMEKGTSMPKAYKDTREFLKNKKVRNVFEGMQKVDSVFVSIGSLIDEANGCPHGTVNLLSEMNLSESQLKKAQVVGDINYSYFDPNGQTRDEWSFLLTLGVRDLRMMVDAGKKVVVIVGNYKANALVAVLKGKLCSVLITDHLAAQRLLENIETE